MVLVLGIVRASLEILGIGIGVKKAVLLRSAPYMIKVFREVANNFQEDFCWSYWGVGGDEKDRVIKFPQLDKAADKKFEGVLQ